MQKPTPTGMSIARPAVRPPRQGGQCARWRRGPAWCCPCRCRFGIAQDRRVVGERRRGADIARAVGDAAQVLQPAGRDQRVAVQQNHVTPGGCAHARVGAGREAAIAPVADQPDAPLPRQSSERGGQLRLRRRIVDHDQPARPGTDRPERCRGRRACGSVPPCTGRHIATADAEAGAGEVTAPDCRGGASGAARGRIQPRSTAAAEPTSVPRAGRAGCPADPCRRDPSRAAGRSGHSTRPPAR